MSAEIDSIIASAAEGLNDGGDSGGDTGDTSGSGDADLSTAGTEDAGTDAGDVAGEEVSAGGPPAEPSAADAARTAEDLAFDAELAELGLSAPKPGQRDNRIPYSRIRKIVANAKTKWSEKLKGEHTTELSARDQKIKDNEDRAAQFDAAEKLIETDDARYIGLLAQIYPEKYGKYVKGAADPAQPQKPQEPQPDVKYDDGSLGYSPEQFAKLREYDRKESARQAKEETTKEFDQRFGPIEQAYKTTQREAEQVHTVRSHIGKLREQWGADLIDNPDVQKAIVAHMDANPKDTLVTATRTVVMGRIQTDRNTMRAEILKEQRLASKAAASAPAAPTKSDATVDQSIDDIIRAASKGIR